MIRPVVAFDSVPHLRKAELCCVNFLAAGDEPGNRAEAHADSRRTGINEPRKCVAEHARIEFVSFAIDIDIGPRKAGREKRCPETWCRSKQFVDKAVLRPPQGQRVQPRRREEVSRIFSTAVRRRENQRKALHHWALKVEDAESG